MRYERVKDVVRLAMRLQGARGGLTLDDIRTEFSISRRTAERLRDAVDEAFGPLIVVDRDERKRYWRLQSPVLQHFVSVSPEELTELSSAAETLERRGLGERATLLRDLAAKIRATLPDKSLRTLETDWEALMEAEGLAMRPGPRPRLAEGLLSLLREALKACRVVTFRYRAQSTGRRSLRRVQPYGLLYGNRAFLVGRTTRGNDMRLWRLSNMSKPEMTEETFTRAQDFDLRTYAKRSFGVFQEEPLEVVLRFDAGAAPDARTFLFHPDQTTVKNKDKSLTVRFKAGGLNEMCWHLITWGEGVTIEQPAELRQRLAHMCATLAAHHAD